MYLKTLINSLSSLLQGTQHFKPQEKRNKFRPKSKKQLQKWYFWVYKR